MATMAAIADYGAMSRLLDFKTQERYYTKIIERYMSFCTSARKGDELTRRFASLNLSSTSSSPASSGTAAIAPSSDNSTRTIPSPTPAPTFNGLSKSIFASSTSTPTPTPSPSPSSTTDAHHLTTLLTALRKLREALLASHRTDTFSTQALLFSIRLAIQLRSWQDYHAPLRYLLYEHQFLTPAPLESSLSAEFVGYLVLDTACRVGDLRGAYEVRRRFVCRDRLVDSTLRAIVRGDFCSWRKVTREVDALRAGILEFRELEMRRHALKCLGRGYLSVELGFLEGVTGRRWGELVRLEGVGWELEGREEEGGRRKVVIRKPKGKS
jgi:hypothetical protein